MKRCFILALLIFGFCLSAKADALKEHEWRWHHQQPLFDLTVDAVLNQPGAYSSWRSQFELVFRSMIEKVPISAPIEEPTFGASVQRDGYKLQQLDFQFSEDLTIPSLLAVPDRLDPRKPIVIALHGHEIPHRGDAPYKMMEENYWPERWVKAGYVVWMPSHLWYKQLKPLVDSGHSHHIVWVKMLSRLLDAGLPRLPEHSGVFVTGLSSGGSSASILMAYRKDVIGGVFAGSFISLDFLRENYRAGFDQWDIKQLLSYNPIYALLPLRSVQWQMGRTDSFFPGLRPMEPINRFQGTHRPVSVSDLLGSRLIVERIFSNNGGAADLHLHDGGHEYDFSAALDFMETTVLPASRSAN